MRMEQESFPHIALITFLWSEGAWEGEREGGREGERETEREGGERNGPGDRIGDKREGGKRER